MRIAQKIYEILSNYTAYNPREYSIHYSFTDLDVKTWRKPITVGSSTYNVTATLYHKILYFSFIRNASFSSTIGRTKEEIQKETREFLQVFPKIQQFFYSVYQQIKKDITSIEFDTVEQDYSRTKLYDHIASRLAKQFNMIFNKVKNDELIMYQLIPKS